MKRTFLIIILLFCSYFELNNYIINYKNNNIFIEFIVTATIYKSGKITASRKTLDTNNYGVHKFIAISRDLQKYFKFGDKVFIEGAGNYDGEYVVEDLMNERWSNKIDILVDKKDKLNKFYNVKIKKLK